MKSNNYILELEAELTKLLRSQTPEADILAFVKDKAMESFKNGADAGRRDAAGRRKASPSRETR